MDADWQQTFQKRIGEFKRLRPAQPGDIPVSIKLRVTSGCFHHEHSPHSYALIDAHLESLTLDSEILEHESGPEILAYLAAATAGLTLVKSVIDLITAIIKARSEGVKKGDRPDAPLELIVRSVDDAREYKEETVLRIGHMEPISPKAVEKQLRRSIDKLSRPSEAVTLERARSLANEAMFIGKSLRPNCPLEVIAGIRPCAVSLSYQARNRLCVHRHCAFCRVAEWMHRLWCLAANIRARADKQFALLKSNPQHPSLQFKKLGDRNGPEIWSARVTLKYRVLAVKLPDEYLWFWIGEHNVYDALIK